MMVGWKNIIKIVQMKTVDSKEGNMMNRMHPFILPRLELFCRPLHFRSVMDELKQRPFCLTASTFSIRMK